MGINADLRNMKTVLLFAIAFVIVAMQADELKDLSSADVAPPAAEKQVDAQEKEDLGEGTGNFSGALMTSGSFTMMAATGFEEEELGEGEGTGNFSWGSHDIRVLHHD